MQERAIRGQEETLLKSCRSYFLDRALFTTIFCPCCSTIEHANDANFLCPDSKPVLYRQPDDSHANISNSTISWNPREVTYIATLTFGLPVNFTSNESFQNIELVASDELKGLVTFDYPPELQINVTANKLHHPVIAVEIGPNTTGGWHNGTVSLVANGSVLADPLEVNVLVPKLTKIQFPVQNGMTFYNIMVPSFSPLSNNSVNIFNWLAFANGSMMPYSYPGYDALPDPSSVPPNITLQTDKPAYVEGETIRFTARAEDYNASKNIFNETPPVELSLSIYRADPFVSVYETYLPVNDTGTFSLSVPVNSSLAQAGSYNIYFLERDVCFDIQSSNLSNQTNPDQESITNASRPSSLPERPSTLQSTC